jgi:predicted nucleic acid-binding protein
MYLVDTNVVSELRKGARANAGVRAFFANLRPEDIYLSVQTIGELRRGLENIRGRGDKDQAERLEAWLDLVTDAHASRILAFDLVCSQVWGKLMSPNPQHPVDKQIAAIGLVFDLIVVTRNTADFASTGVRVINPFS